MAIEDVTLVQPSDVPDRWSVRRMLATMECRAGEVAAHLAGSPLPIRRDQAQQAALTAITLRVAIARRLTSDDGLGALVRSALLTGASSTDLTSAMGVSSEELSKRFGMLGEENG